MSGGPAETSRAVPLGVALRVAVIGDSTAFSDGVGPQLPDHPDLWPNALTRTLQARLSRPVHLTVWARPGTDALAAWQALTKDRHVMFDVVGPADVVVVGVGSLDHAPAGLPPIVDVVLPHVRPAGLRRRLRRVVRAMHPVIVRIRRSRGVRTPVKEFARRYGLLLDQARGLTMGRAVCVALGPTSHRARHHGSTHPRREESERRQLELARGRGWTTVPVWELVEPHVDRLNPDGVHWPAAAHAAIGAAVADAVVEQLGQADPLPATTDGRRPARDVR
jgi:lysophospholipase L1-like esterase